MFGTLAAVERSCEYASGDKDAKGSLNMYLLIQHAEFCALSGII